MPKIQSIQDKNDLCIQSLVGGKSSQGITRNMAKVIYEGKDGDYGVGATQSLLPSPHRRVQVDQQGEHNANIIKTY